LAGWEKLPDDALCKAVMEMAHGLIDADLGGFLYKKRLPRPGGGKSGGYRTVLSARIGERYVFLHGFAKKDKANITQDEKKALQFAGKVFLGSLSCRTDEGTAGGRTGGGALCPASSLNLFAVISRRWRRSARSAR
jgi:hypothetical protein